jgi:pyruvate dehydrogenase E1 component
VAALASEGVLTLKDVTKAIELYDIDAEKPNPIGV